MALDPVQHTKKKTQNDIVAHAGAWAQDQVAPHPPSPSAMSSLSQPTHASSKCGPNHHEDPFHLSDHPDSSTI
ncbi:hypothetical protein LCI18_011909 [Fusarium solani-melongenae]|uniref:Uncharacterized protein n=1 Tax=Fusarium solani subsp. cucurbitae TaxID=2747967 RepID=A0ACD3ZI05_FUSSC|nr:hypothetical protein LCI18_011909 [Fusarium solani-melongenae]